jgi:predicted TIM-barrel fold metal-dependent hydrolase
VIIDVHCHYTFSALLADGRRFSFEPVEARGVHAFDSFVSPRAARRLSFRLMLRLLDLPRDLNPGPELDAAIGDANRRHLGEPLEAAVSAFRSSPFDNLNSRAIDRFVLLAFDAYHDDDGRRPAPPSGRGDRGADIYTSNSAVRRACEESPGRFLFGASVHPYRENAVECVQEVFDAGACLIKWLPLHQNIDIADPRTVAVLRRCAKLGLPLLVHYSSEFTLTTQHREHQDVGALLDVLRGLRAEEAMPPVIVAHVATPVSHWLGPRHDHEQLVAALLGEFADAPLYADISALTALPKHRYLRAMARRQELHGKLLFGSDFPVPVTMTSLRGLLGEQYDRIAAIESWPERALKIFRCIGFNEIVFHRAAELLANVDHFARSDSAAGAIR